jgi:hypothetical protein
VERAGASIRWLHAERDKESGTEPSKPFNPDEKTRCAMKAAVVDAYFYMDNLVWKWARSHYIWPDG